MGYLRQFHMQFIMNCLVSYRTTSILLHKGEYALRQHEEDAVLRCVGILQLGTVCSYLCGPQKPSYGRTTEKLLNDIRFI